MRFASSTKASFLEAETSLEESRLDSVLSLLLLDTMSDWRCVCLLIERLMDMMDDSSLGAVIIMRKYEVCV